MTFVPPEFPAAPQIEERVVAVLRLPLAIDAMAKATKALERGYGKGLVLLTAHPLARQGFLVYARPEPEQAPE